MILEILKYPDPRLAATSKSVEEVTGELRRLASDMLETMYNSNGVGLAAPQIGRFIRMLVMDPHYREDEKNPRVFINPRLEMQGKLIISQGEGCLSVPLNFRADVPRYSRVKVTGLGLDGEPIEETLEDFPAIVLQHEVDHLDGCLFIDKISHLRRNIYDGKVKKWQKSHA